MKIEDIHPQGDNVVAEVIKLPTEVDGVYIGEGAESNKLDIQFYHGRVRALGDEVNIAGINKDTGVMFSHFAGYHVETEDGFCKVVSQQNIVAIIEDMEKLNEHTIFPVGERILVKIINESLVSDEGVYNDSTPDPRQADTQKGEVMSVAEGVIGFNAGDIVAFDPYVGNIVLDTPGTLLKTIEAPHILFKIL